MLLPKNVKRLPSPGEIARDHPLSDAARMGVARHRREVRRILAGEDGRLLVIVGPCSAWPAPAVLEYARRLHALEAKVAGDLKLVMRVYVQKPRTTRGWTGPVNQPDPFAAPDIEAGMRYARKMMVDVVELGLPIADEAVFTHNAGGFAELMTWVAIGARSSEDQEHRVWASAADMPVGLKNPTSGCIPVGVNGVVAAQHAHTAVFDGFQVETSGNEYAHLVLRGGAHGPNYRLPDLLRARRYLRERVPHHPALLVDASHENCRAEGRKDPRVQSLVVSAVLDHLHARADLRDTVRGFMLESFLRHGCQRLEGVSPARIDRTGLSVTDPCLGWEETRELIVDLARRHAAFRQRPAPVSEGG